MKWLLTGLVPLGLLVAQQTHTEVNTKPNPSEDARANSSSVPSAYALDTKFDRIVIMRFKFGTDLLAGLEELTAKEHIRNGVFLSALGSVRNYQVHVVDNRGFPPRNMFIKDPTGPADITSVNGYIVGGRVHAHITLATGEKAFGGHLEKGTNVFTFAVVTVGVLPDSLDISKVDDFTYR